jgi:hypothetical protein
MGSKFTINDLVGVWRRRSIETGDGQKDTTTQVFWLQTHFCFGDIRIPIDRTLGLDRHSLEELTGEEAIALSTQQGFGGITQVEGTTCQWHRRIDYQPPNGSRDIGSLAWEQDILIELGVEATYREEWERLDDGSTGCIALVLEPDESLDASSRWQGCFVLVGDYFVQILEHRIALPNADSLKDLLAATPDSAKLRDYLNCEISFGRRSAGQIPWEIQLSTLPWREGRSLWTTNNLSVDLDRKCVTQIVDTAAAQQTYQWKIWEWDSQVQL